ncbi:unnamed protein product [Allacma fusca]|nr:unnamed protein product [Allacma fusca]
MEYDCLFLTEKFDCIISTEQLQVQDHRKFLTSIGKYLKDDGLFLFETPGAQSCNSNLEFLTNSSTIHVPTNTLDFSLESIPDLFVIEEIENFGEHFYKTFEAWIDKLEKNSSDLKRVYGENTIRKFKFSYVCNAEGFRMAKFQWWQILLSKKHKEGVHSCSFSELFDEDFL